MSWSTSPSAPAHSDKKASHASHQLSIVLVGDTMVPNIEQDYILLLGYSILYKEYDLTRVNHQKNTTQLAVVGLRLKEVDGELGGLGCKVQRRVQHHWFQGAVQGSWASRVDCARLK